MHIPCGPGGFFRFFFIRGDSLHDGKYTEAQGLVGRRKQKGKAFTIYPSNKKQFKQLAHDIDYIIRLNNLEKEDTNIKGDKQLGDTGRIFYRYVHKSGETKDKIFHFDNDTEMDEYDNQYDPNRGANQYLASDMTIKDDPFYHFKPHRRLV